MKISVITVCYNSQETIENTILSVINQTYSDIEYIVIDGNSTDRTLEIIDKYKDRINYFVSEPDSGMYNAMNKGIKAATGDYVYILNSDDTFYNENTIKNFVEAASNEIFEVFIGNLIFIETDRKTPIIKFDEVDKMSMYYFGLHQQALFYNRTIFEKYGYLSENYKLASDIVWLYDRLFFEKYKLKIKYLNQIFCNFKIGGRSNNESHKILSTKERSMITQKYLNQFQMKIYEIYKYKTYPVMHKYFRSLARNPKISEPINKAVRGVLRFIFDWKINMVKD
jgi:glycosyltransferase